MILRTGWDIDGVGHVFGDSFHNWLIHTGRGDLWKSGPTPKPFWDWYKDWGWTSEQFVAECHEAADAGILFDGPIRDGYVESIKAVAQAGHQIIIATDRPFGSSPEVSEKITVNWLDRHGIEFDELWFTADKTLPDCDYFIEDKLENYDDLVSAGTKAFLLNRPWNEIDGGDARNRINSIEEYAYSILSATKEGHFDLSLV